MSPMSNSSKWQEMFSYPFGGGRLELCRSKEPFPAEKMSQPGYGYFALYHFNEQDPKFDKEVRDARLPLQLLPFLRRKFRELQGGTKLNEHFEAENINYGFLVADEGDKITLFIQKQMKESELRGNKLEIDKYELYYLIVFLEAMTILTKKQPERVPAEEYHEFCLEMMGWCTAKRTYEEVCETLKPGRALTGIDEYNNKLNIIKGTNYADYIKWIELLATTVKERIPIKNPNLLSYDDTYAEKGFTYSYPEHKWQPLQALVHMIHEAAFPASAVSACKRK